jgi:hypothetical protein
VATACLEQGRAREAEEERGSDRWWRSLCCVVVVVVVMDVIMMIMSLSWRRGSIMSTLNISNNIIITAWPCVAGVGADARAGPNARRAHIRGARQAGASSVGTLGVVFIIMIVMIIILSSCIIIIMLMVIIMMISWVHA